ncbi:hypothetical protein ACIGZJ_30980 [Kitasatospora sp. NPDC052868]|uniref:hypothetical protein n=1 Tax=Kitasatospora sp. NPDC052868 TaxID=3364060 RepID=UPI0037CC1B2A
MSCDFDTWWDGATPEERADLLDDSVDLPDADPAYPPWWRKPWPVWLETDDLIPTTPDLDNYPPEPTA